MTTFLQFENLICGDHSNSNTTDTDADTDADVDMFNYIHTYYILIYSAILKN